MFWTTFFDELDADYQPPVVYAHTEAAAKTTPCGFLSVAQYCPNSNTVHLDMLAMSSFADSIGDAAAYAIVAHEYSHSAQYQLGLFPSGESSVKLELQADCLAGAFFAVADKAGMARS